jgi:hypothetical protein
MSESAYSWRNDGQLLHPPPNHPTNSVKWAIEDFGDVKSSAYIKRVTQAICHKSEPSRAERTSAWDEYAYWIYIPGSVGEGAGGRRTEKMWKAGKRDFERLVEGLEPEPEKVIITSLSAWKNMKESDVHLTDTLQAYRLKSSGSLMWCLAVPHPASRKRGKGFRWSEIAEQIALFRSTVFPKKWKPNS